MQKPSPESDADPAASAAGATAGVLEDPNRVELHEYECDVYCNGHLVATFEQLLESPAVVEKPEHGLNYWVCSFERMCWSHTGVLLHLQGERVLNILGPSVCLTRGYPTPAWDPRPGMKDVSLIIIMENAKGLSTAEVFQIHSSG